MVFLALFVFILGVLNSIVLYMLWRGKQSSEQHYAKEIERLGKAHKELSRRLDIYLAGSVSMGEELDQLQKNLGPLPEKILRMEQRDLSSLSFTQAARLIGLGASTDDLKQSCGLSQSEAELLQRLHGKKTNL